MAVKMFRQTFTVEGFGIFPVDMLRYDQCFPASETDSGIIEASNSRDRRAVKLRRNIQTKGDYPTGGRWESFGWKVGIVETEK